MRLSREDLITMYPSWNEGRHDIVKACYGDIPLKRRDKAYYEGYRKLTGTLSNIEGVEAYMWRVNGDYDIYRTLIGEVYITVGGSVLGGSISVIYKGKSHNISLNLMYGLKALNILKLSGKVAGFCSKDGAGSPCNKHNTTELDREAVEKVLSADLSDYGESVKAFMKECVNLYNEVDRNYIMEKTFNL